VYNSVQNLQHAQIFLLAARGKRRRGGTSSIAEIQQNTTMTQNTKSVEAGSGHRLLKMGEAIELTDEIFYEGNWTPLEININGIFLGSIGPFSFPTRRVE
jgi:hypothetical protein